MKLLKDSAIYLFGQLFAKALPFLLLPYLTRKLGAAGFGELSYYQTILTLLMMFLGLSQDGALTRYYYFYGKRNLPNLMLTGYGYTLALMLPLLLFAWWRQSLILATVICTAASQTIIATQLAWRQCQKRALAYATIQITSGISGSLITIFLLEITSNQPVIMRFLAIFLGNIFVSLIAYCLIRQKNHSKITWQRFWRSGSYIIAFGAPLLLHNASGFVKGQLDRIIIYQHYTPAELGIYAAALQIASILYILLQSVNSATVPHYYQYLKQGSLNAQKVRQLATIGLLISPLFSLIIWLLPEKLFIWFLGQQYTGTHNYIILFTFGFALNIPYFLLVNYLFYHGKNQLISLISMTSAGIYLLALFLLTPLGLKWIPYAMILGNFAILPILYYFVRDPKNVQAA